MGIKWARCHPCVSNGSTFEVSVLWSDVRRELFVRCLGTNCHFFNYFFVVSLVLSVEHRSLHSEFVSEGIISRSLIWFGWCVFVWEAGLSSVVVFISSISYSRLAVGIATAIALENQPHTKILAPRLTAVDGSLASKLLKNCQLAASLREKENTFHLLLDR